MKYVIEHMEEGFSEWVILEYSQIIRDVGRENLILTSLPKGTTENDIPDRLLSLGLQWTTDECVTLDGGLKSDRVCLLDPAATEELVPQDAPHFDYFVFGGILGSHPRIDRTGILREKYGFAGRRLGALQMTTDTAIRTTQLIIEKQTKFEDIKFIDYPEIRYNKYESTEMPFRYVLDAENVPILPEGMLKLIEKDADQSIDDLLVE
ncbi:Rps3 or RNA methylase involved in ribosome biogenesis, SPOUT family [Metschnikowia aff. pulcherrima]|uniref:Rps3 or RNA methylase involved in ribosome biogenesis, SPOUT family n=1 Tax=Metschnikowia aff. pulcherrima TaxID=2163413 RepID=A0A4P6XMV2_9ASCO|nr:Rps3 or RNA methylase involved in ribosome biogenesis, SPOUT family [Metschnikowia aff. pulcherrima]